MCVESRCTKFNFTVRDKKLQSHSSEARAQHVLEKDNITFDSKLHVFNVKGVSGVTRVVTLFPNATCSCPSMGDCYHVLAAKMSLGMSVCSKSDKRSLTQLRKNTRTRREKKSGRKQPCPNDIPAGIMEIQFIP